MANHETIQCEKCGSAFECKTGSPDICDCRKISLDLNELQFIAENYANCLCLNCLAAVKRELKLMS